MLDFKNKNAEIFIPDNESADISFQRTTHMTIAAHQDDIEIMSYQAIARCFQDKNNWFCGVVVTNGSGSPRNGLYKDYTDDQMMEVRSIEQKKAAYIGEYSALVMLNYSSAQTKDAMNQNIIDDLKELVSTARPKVVYTHNLADKHNTHVAVVLRTIEALRQLKKEERPEKLYGCEMWKSLDWMIDEDKIMFDVGSHPNIASSLLGVFDSQITGGKRYDKATEGRRVTNATYAQTHSCDSAKAVSFGIDLTPLVENPQINIYQYIKNYINRFNRDVEKRIIEMI